MKSLPRYRIPVGWGDPTLLHPFMERLPADTLVLPIPGDLRTPYEVERIHGSWSPHIPEKCPKFKITMEGYGSDHIVYADVTRLSLLVIGTKFLVERPVKGKQVCFESEEGQLHSLLYSAGPGYVLTVCGKSPYISTDEHNHRRTYLRRETEPNCPQCAFYSTAWVGYTVFPYGRPEEPKKKVDAEKRAERKFLRRPTVYARILDDAFLTEEPPTYKTPPSEREAIDEDPYEEYEIDPRDGKLATARERNQRMKSAKRDSQGR